MNGLKLKNLSKSFNGLAVVDGVTAFFLAGRITALVGPNGAGKTTIFHLVTGELKPDKGEIIYKDKVIASLPPFQIARNGVGRLFQDIRIFDNLTVYENVASACQNHEIETPWYPFVQIMKKGGTQKEIKDNVIYWLDYVGLYEEKETGAGNLSYGQRKLLALARLLALGSSLLLLDEPAAGLSPAMVKKILHLLEKILTEDSNKTIVIVEHDMAVVKQIANWVYFMNEGRIAFFGKPDHVLGDKEVRAIYLGL